MNKVAYSVTEAAEMLSISRKTLYKIMDEDSSFPVFRVGRCVRISAGGLSEWINKQTEGQRHEN